MLAKITVADYMTTRVVSSGINAESSLVDLAEHFQTSSIRTFPVFQAGERALLSLK